MEKDQIFVHMGIVTMHLGLTTVVLINDIYIFCRCPSCSDAVTSVVKSGSNEELVIMCLIRRVRH